MAVQQQRASEVAARLILPSDESGREVPLTGRRLSIGRHGGNELVLQSKFVSDRHAWIAKRDTSYLVWDRGSRNGTFVNGERIHGRQRLTDGDRISFGDVQVVFRSGSDHDSASGTGILQSPIADDGGAPSTSEITLDIGKREVFVRGVRVEPVLSVQEFDLLRMLWDVRGQARSLTEVGDAIWGIDCYEPNMIHRLVSRLKRKLARANTSPDVIKSVRGFGYRLDIEF